MTAEYSRICGRILAMPELDQELWKRLRDEFQSCDSREELNDEAREWYDRFAASLT